LPLTLVLCACPSTPSTTGGGGGSAGTGGGSASSGGGSAGTGGGTSSTGGGSGGGGIAGVDLLAKLPGLWSGPAMMTPLGNFPHMAFDLRPVDNQFVFGQAELDSADTLRFGFNIETYGGRDVLAYRNGGYFQGVLRDSRTSLQDSDGGTWHFCYVGDGGCSYIDAKFTVTDTTLVLDTHVRGQPHVYWNATKLESRTVPQGFPSDLASRGDGSAPWPTLATVQVNASFGAAVTADADAWLILTTTACFPTFGCNESRAVSVAVPAQSSMAQLSLPNVHAGAYKVSVILDVDKNFASTLGPSSGDRVAVDQDLTVPASGTATLNVTTSYTVP
jgi:hypothetical protein